jgi:glycosyltransferase involved in cell wall biosynthesis
MSTPIRPVDTSDSAETAPRTVLPVGTPSISVVIPAKNEARNLPWVLSRLPVGLHEVILVDGGSVDHTVETARRQRPGIIVVPQTRRGKGNALACGFAACTGDVIVMLDADGSADPAEIVEFTRALCDGADVAKGSRFTPGGGSADITRIRGLGNRLLTGLVNLAYGTSFTDLCYGYNAFWAWNVKAFGLPDVDGTEPRQGDGFEIETVIAVRAVAAGLTIAEVPSYEHLRRHGESNLHTFRDGWRVLRTIVRERWSGSRRSAPEPAAATPRTRPA